MDTSVWSLWLPILVSGIALFIASCLAWMVLPHHKKEWVRLPNEESIMKQIKGDALPPGQYCFPFAASAEDTKSEAYKAKMKAGPHGTLTLWRDAPNMAVNIACTLAFFLVTNFVIAYLAGIALDPGEEAMKVFRFVGTAGILTYGTANILNGIWFGRKMVADIVDGIAYGLITGAIFAALWPPGTAS
jgi:hypothetical protein